MFWFVFRFLLFVSQEVFNLYTFAFWQPQACKKEPKCRTVAWGVWSSSELCQFHQFFADVSFCVRGQVNWDAA